MGMPLATYFLPTAAKSMKKTPPETGWFLDFLRAPRTLQVVGVSPTRLGVLCKGHEMKNRSLRRTKVNSTV